MRSFTGATLSAAMLITTLSCASSSEKLVNKVTSYTDYYKSSYAEKCHNGPKNPASCTPCQEILEKAERRAFTANQTYKLGYMAPQETTELKETIAQLMSFCP